MSEAAVIRITCIRPKGPNAREHWAARARRVKAEREIAAASALAQLGPDGIRALRRTAKTRGLDVLITREGGRRMDDDNLAAALKAVRDGIADALRVDDGSTSVRWHYAQQAGRRDVVITIKIAARGELKDAS